MNVCKHCGRRIQEGPLRAALPWVHITDTGVAGPERCNPGESHPRPPRTAEPFKQEEQAR